MAQGIEEIVVTAQKREQSLQDVGISVTAFSGRQIEELGFSGSEEISRMTPGLLFTLPGGSASIGFPAIRGVSQNDFGPHQEVPNAVCVDEAYLSFNGANQHQMFDLERVEVLRGPQGTLFGRNATGGLIHYVSRRPTREFEGYGDLTIGEHDQVRFQGAVSGPLTDRLQGRLSFATDHNDSYIENRVGPDTGENESWSGRGQLLFQPTDDVEVHVSLFGGVNDSDALGPYQRRTGIPDADGLGVNLDENVDFYGTCPGCDPFGYIDNDGDPHAMDIDRVGFLERDTWGITGKLTWEFDRFTLTSITHYLEFSFDYLEDQDVSPVAFTEFAFGQDADQFSQEIRLNGEMDRLRWVAGFYYLGIESANHMSFHLLPPFVGVLLDTAWSVDTESWAVFGQFEYDLAPRWTFIGGLRWTEDRKEIDLLNTVTVVGVGAFDFPFNEATVGPLAEQDDGDYSFKVELDYRPVDDWLLYASITRGNKGGSFSAPLDMSATPPASVPYGPETILAYEIGLKSQFLDGRARLNAAAFYYDYDDYQAFRLENLVQVVFNAQARIYGAEVEFLLEPADGWLLMLGASLLDAEVEDVVLPSGRVTDREPPQAPAFTLNGLLRREWAAFGGTMAVQADFNYVDDYQASVLNSPATHIPSHVIGNARLSWAPADERWEMAVFVKNIADAEAETYAFDLVNSGLPFNQIIYLPPRWVGGQVIYRW